MTCGSAVVGVVPNVDATIETRVIEAGATVVGKSNVDDVATTTTGHCGFGPVFNPHDDDRPTGGSSGGSAVAVATGQVDAVLGTDRGGSNVPAVHRGSLRYR